MRRSSLFVLLFWLVMLVYAPTCLAAEPLRIAVLPVINQSPDHNRAVEKVISEALYDKFRVPLNDIRHVYEVLPSDEVSAALPPGIQNRPGSLKFRPEILQNAADKLQADIVIGAVITDLREGTFTTWRGDYIQRTHLAIRLIVYNANTRKYLDRHDYESYFGESIIDGDADHLAKVIMRRQMARVTVKPE